MDGRPLDQRFEEHRRHLHAVAYRMLGSVREADDAVQETWLKLARADVAGIDNLGGWLTTVLGRVCLDQLRWRRTRREEPLDPFMPDPVVDGPAGVDPAHEVELADSVGLAMLVVLETLSPAERLAYVLHDMFAVPFDEVAAIAGRSPESARQLASRARRRVAASAVTPDRDLARQRRAVDAFFAAARKGDFEALVAVLDPDVVLRADAGAAHPAATAVVRGAAAVAGRALMFSRPGATLVPLLVNGLAGVGVTDGAGRLLALMAFTVVDDRVVAIDSLSDPPRLAALSIPSSG
jgi:RNA polymerase sigma-70 factor (ECF subfamily)